MINGKIILMFFKNPLSLWIKYVVNSLFYFIINRDKRLNIGFMSVVSNCNFSLHNNIGKHVILNNSKFGDFTYVSDHTILNNVNVGKFTSIGPYVLAGLGKHPTRKFVSTHPAFYSSDLFPSIKSKHKFEEFSNIEIGSDVWIGARVIILDGISIGTGAIIAAGSVVTKDVADFSVVAGVPAKVIKYRFEKKYIDFLLELKWWDKDIIWIEKNSILFDEIDSLFNIHNQIKK